MSRSIIDQLQSEQHEWSARNFPNATPDEPFMGIVEEVGELSHALLKGKQGIRGTPEEHEAAAKDALGDIFIFMLHFCNLRGWNLHDIVTETWNGVVAKRDWRANPKDGAQIQLAFPGMGDADLPEYTVIPGEEGGVSSVHSVLSDSIVFKGSAERAAYVAKHLNKCRKGEGRYSLTVRDDQFILTDKNHKVESALATMQAAETILALALSKNHVDWGELVGEDSSAAGSAEPPQHPPDLLAGFSWYSAENGYLSLWYHSTECSHSQCLEDDFAAMYRAAEAHGALRK